VTVSNKPISLVPDVMERVLKFPELRVASNPVVYEIDPIEN